MGGDESEEELRILREESQKIWNQNASFWNDYMGEGGSFQRVLIGPATERLLELQPGELVLEVGCGNGAFARRMAELGGRVVATDFSERFLEHARERTTTHRERIEYLSVDATDEAALLALGKRRFDAAVSSMVLMDIPVIEPLAFALSKLLKSSGRFVFSVVHPCFNSGEGMRKVVEEEDRNGEIRTVHALKISTYIHPVTFKGLGIIGQPAAQYYFHRPLSVLLNAFFKAGFVLDALEEPAFPEGAEGARRPFSWENYHEIPPVLVARLRLSTLG